MAVGVNIVVVATNLRSVKKNFQFIIKLYRVRGHQMSRRYFSVANEIFALTTAKRMWIQVKVDMIRCFGKSACKLFSLGLTMKRSITDAW